MRKICVSLVGLVFTLVGCNADNPNACRPDGGHECSGGLVCSPTTYTCQKADASVDGPAVDTRVADVPVGTTDTGSELRDASPDKVVDVAPDLRVPDAAGSCGGENECKGDRPFCVAQACVECLTSQDCKNANTPLCIGNACTGCKTASADAGATDAGAGPTCKDKEAKLPVCGPSGACVECTADSQCGGATPLCIGNKCQSCANDKACANKDAKHPMCAPSGACVECTGSSQCSNAAQPLCVGNACVKCGDAKDDVTCANKSSAAPACNTTSGACVECTGPGNCKTAGKLACNTTKNVCVQCTQDTDCGDKAPVCDQTTNTCKGCSTDSQCNNRGSGICMAHVDGRCASVDETIYVGKSGCSASGSGTSSVPFCTAQQGVNAVNAARRLIVVRGTVDGFSWTGSGDQLSIVGLSNATLAGASDPAIAVTQGDLYVRDLTATSSAAPAVSASGGAILRLNRVKVTDSRGGGILLDGASFELTDVLVSGNGPGDDVGTSWGGIRIKSPPAAGPKRLDRVSATDNKQVGISCTTTISGTGVLAARNSGGVEISPTCGLGDGCGTTPSATCGSSLTP